MQQQCIPPPPSHTDEVPSPLEDFIVPYYPKRALCSQTAGNSQLVFRQQKPSLLFKWSLKLSLRCVLVMLWWTQALGDLPWCTEHVFSIPIFPLYVFMHHYYMSLKFVFSLPHFLFWPVSLCSPFFFFCWGFLSYSAGFLLYNIKCHEITIALIWGYEHKHNWTEMNFQALCLVLWRFNFLFYQKYNYDNYVFDYAIVKAMVLCGTLVVGSVMLWLNAVLALLV